MPSPILIGSTFPLSLIRRPVHIAPRPLEEAGLIGCPDTSISARKSFFHAPWSSKTSSTELSSEEPYIAMTDSAILMA
jgi:hypothetical protein